MTHSAVLRVDVVYSPQARQVQARTLLLPAGATVRQALIATQWWPPHAWQDALTVPGTAPSQDTESRPALSLGIWGRHCALDSPLHDGDRVEVCRALLIDPKVARRERFQQQGARSAGLFAQRRPGAKAGY